MKTETVAFQSFWKAFIIWNNLKKRYLMFMKSTLNKQFKSFKWYFRLKWSENIYICGLKLLFILYKSRWHLISMRVEISKTNKCDNKYPLKNLKVLIINSNENWRFLILETLALKPKFLFPKCSHWKFKWNIQNILINLQHNQKLSVKHFIAFSLPSRK